jgi:glutamine synthetase
LGAGERQRDLKVLFSQHRSEAMFPKCATAQDLVRAIKDEKVQMIDLRFTDLPGVWQHFSVPPSAANVDALEEGIGFDGSSIRGFQEIQESDMLVVPDRTTTFLDPYSFSVMCVFSLLRIFSIERPGSAFGRKPDGK